MSNIVTKNHLIAAVLKRIVYLPNIDIRSSVDLVIDYLKEQLAQQNKIEIRNFGSFSVRKRRRAKSLDEYNTIYFRTARSTALRVKEE
ncbi:MAG: HU family DNA-binding protein [Janthinobacterium lividum]